MASEKNNNSGKFSANLVTLALSKKLNLNKIDRA